MPHEISRILRAAATRPWFIDPRKGDEIIAMLELRAGGKTEGMAPSQPPAATQSGSIAVLPVIGTITPRASLISESSGAFSLVRFQAAFRQAASDPNISAIVIEVDSPGGQADLVPETAAMIRGARREGRPIVAVANTLAASAGYWIASAADELVVTPSGEVGSIGAYLLHQDISEALALEGIAVTMISEGARKTEGNPFQPLDDVARTALQESIRNLYDLFCRDVAKARGVPVARVKADPETTDKHFGGGRCYPAAEAVRLGMADRVATLAETIDRLRGGGRRPRR